MEGGPKEHLESNFMLIRVLSIRCTYSSHPVITPINIRNTVWGEVAMAAAISRGFAREWDRCSRPRGHPLIAIFRVKARAHVQYRSPLSSGVRHFIPEGCGGGETQYCARRARPVAEKMKTHNQG